MDEPPMPPIRLDHIAVAFPRIADAPGALVAVLGAVPGKSCPVETFREAEVPSRPDPAASAPPDLPDPPPPVHILGLRPRAQSRLRAVTRWSGVAQGAMTEGRGGGLVFRWPDSPMRLVVDIDPRADEGPVAFEIAAERPIPSLDAAGAALGIRLRLPSA
jgi:hypothetical protein